MTIAEQVQALEKAFASHQVTVQADVDMPCLCVPVDQLSVVMQRLRDDEPGYFQQLTDLCGVDYSLYGCDEWTTDNTANTGYSRARGEQMTAQSTWSHTRFCVTYHLLSISANRRLRVQVFLDDETPRLPSVVDIWPAANWFERETYDLFGIVFDGHPDLRRILTDYGFHGHPFRKDFPLIGEVEMRYDATLQRCVYEPVSIKNRVVVPRVIRQDNRWLSSAQDNMVTDD